MNSEPKICVKKKFTKIKNIPLYIIGWFTMQAGKSYCRMVSKSVA